MSVIAVCVCAFCLFGLRLVALCLLVVYVVDTPYSLVSRHTLRIDFSGVTDHFAENDAHAITIARRIVSNLNMPYTNLSLPLRVRLLVCV